jgi:hypothetical protein
MNELDNTVLRGRVCHERPQSMQVPLSWTSRMETFIQMENRIFLGHGEWEGGGCQSKHTGFFLRWENVLKLTLGIVVSTCEYTSPDRVVDLTWVHCMMCDLHFNKIVGKKTKNSSDPGDTLPTT